jgi:hypothetical protein
MGMGQIRINSPERRDRLWLLNALAVALLTMLNHDHVSGAGVIAIAVSVCEGL